MKDYKRFDDSNWKELRDQARAITKGEDGFFARRTEYGSSEARTLGLRPMREYPSNLIATDDFKDVIEECIAKKRFPMYYMERLKQFPNWSQNGYNLCWSFGLSMTLMGTRAVMGLDEVPLAPTSLGYLVNWRNSGYYCDEAINAARTHGIAPLSAVGGDVLNYNRKSFDSDWEDQAKDYRALEWWDGEVSRDEEHMARQIVTMLAAGVPLYIAYNWWSHALNICGVKYDKSARNNLVIVLKNSHGEDDFIELEGSRALPDEFYGIRVASLV